MNTLRNTSLATALVLVSTPCLAEDDLPPLEPQPQSILRMVDAQLKDSEPAIAGRLSNVVLDLEAGQISAWLVETDGHTMIVPFNAFQSLPKQAVIELTARVRQSWTSLPTVGRRTVDRTLVQSALQSLDSQAIAEAPADVDTPLGPLVAITECVGAVVRDADGRQVATLIDISARPDGTLQYAVLEKVPDGAEMEILAVPLGAFVLSAGNQVWRIDLPSELIVKRTSIQRDEATWPVDVDRGWEEFVRVKYGRGLRGVRHD